MIRPGDRVAAVIARDERLIDVFVTASPTFQRLRSPAMRKIMARLVTVAQAARMAGLDPAELVARLEAALAHGTFAQADAAAEPTAAPSKPTEADTAASSVGPGAERPGGATETAALPAGPAAERSGGGEAAATSLPARLAALPPERIVELDVRAELQVGEEPFSRIMAARRVLPPGGALRLRTTFEPVPLYAVLGKQGLGHWTERLEEDDWYVWFYPEEAHSPLTAASSNRPDQDAGSPVAAASSGRPADGAGTDPESGGVVVLDVRGLEPPEPMQRTLEALENLPEGGTLVQLNVREPRFLFPLLSERGWSYEVRRQGDDLVRTFIRRAAAP